MADVFAGMPCTDEDVAREGVGDYAALAPACEVLTSGTDGVLDGTTWGLASASNDFAAQGVQPGHVVVLVSRTVNAKPVPMGRRTLGVSAAAGHVLTLRRFGYAAGSGSPPPASSGVTFQVPSVLVHIATAAVEVRRTLGIDASADLSALPDVNRLAALLTLRSLYFAEYRQTSQDAWKDKLATVQAQIDAEYMSLRDTFPSGDPDGLDATFGPIDLGISRGRRHGEF